MKTKEKETNWAADAHTLHEVREGALGGLGDTVRAGAAKTPRRGQRIEKRGNFNARDEYLAKKCPELAKYGLIPAAFDPADPSSIQTVTEPPSVELECRAACLAARDLAKHYCEEARTHERLALAAKAGLYDLARQMQPACEELLRLADESTAAALRRRLRWLELQVTVLAYLLGVTVVYVVWKGVFA